jgi:CDP-glucose 4,6-dehydratase
MGAKVIGFDKNPNFASTLAGTADIQFDRLILGNVVDQGALSDCFDRHRPEIVFHMAAQALVRQSYLRPADTFLENVQGTVNVLEAIRTSNCVRSGIFITSDKVYRNIDDSRAFREDDPLGGDDPYSASKAASDIAVQSYVKSYFGHSTSPQVRIARAGNVIGGGDASLDRLLPDAVRAFNANEQLVIRSPGATRPWQHVLDSLSGYLLFAEAAHQASVDDMALNFGPHSDDCISVSQLLEMFSENWGHRQNRYLVKKADHLKEAQHLNLNNERSQQVLGWSPTWRVADAVRYTAGWYKQHSLGTHAAQLMESDIDAYLK